MTDENNVHNCSVELNINSIGTNTQKKKVYDRSMLFLYYNFKFDTRK